MNKEVFTLIDILGTAAFSISGVVAAMEKKLDIFGILILAFITAVGGGTIRDVLIGEMPVTWTTTPVYSVVIFISAVIAMFFHGYIRNYSKVLTFFDALGLGFFTLVGIKKGIAFGYSTGFCIALGTITACFGGMIRDICLNHIPRIFHKEVYATACIFGGLLYFLLARTTLQGDVLDAICIGGIVLLRLIAVQYNWSLPSIYPAAKKES